MTDSKSPRIPPVRRPIEAPAAARPALPRGRVHGSRHSAITRNLQSYASYKSWAEKMRTNWEPGKDPEG
jgi:hypothetical protein